MEATFDLPTSEVKPEQRDDLFEFRPVQKTGFDGIKQIFEKEESGIVNPKFRLIGETCAMGYFLGFVVGGKNGIKYGMKDYPAANRHKKFDSVKEALVIYRDRMMMEYFRVGMAAGLKLGIFVSSSVLISFAIASYRGKYSPLDPVVALSITGGLNCIRHGGPRQVVLGGLLGGAMGAALSLPFTGFLYLAGVTMEDMVHMKRKMLLNEQARLAFQRKFEQVMDCEDFTIPSTVRELELWEPPEESKK